MMATSRPPSRPWVQTASVLLASAAIIAALQHFIAWNRVSQSLLRVEGGWLCLAVLGAAVVIGSRACRLAAILKSGPSCADCTWSSIVRLTTRHHAIFSLLPSGAGDLLFPALARRHLGQSVPEAIGSLGIMRLSDLIALGGLGLIACVRYTSMEATGIASIAVGTCMLCYLLYRLDLIARFIGWLLQSIVPKGRVLPQRMSRWIAGLHLSITEWASSPGTRRAARVSCFWTLLSWVATVVMLWGLLQANGQQIDPAQAAFIVVAMNTAGAIAFFSFAGLGVVDVTLFGMLVAFGLAPADAATSAAVTRVVLLGLNLGLPALMELIFMTLAGPSSAAMRRS
jgi:uncharacterized protein (TIRG00374 family)